VSISPLPPENRRTRHLQTALALIALAGTLATPILAYRLGASNADNDAKQRTIADQQAAIDALRADNGRLRTQAANPVVRGSPTPSSPSPSPSPSPDPWPEVGRQWRSGTLTLPSLYCADLDSDAPDWLVTNADCGRDRDILLGQDFQGLRAGAGVVLAVLPREQATPAGCHAEKSPPTAIPYSRLSPKTRVCVRTTYKNVAVLEIVTIDGDPRQPTKITFKVTVWSP
jgi:type II secretory pathway pseudopilin PulG